MRWELMGCVSTMERNHDWRQKTQKVCPQLKLVNDQFTGKIAKGKHSQEGLLVAAHANRAIQSLSECTKHAFLVAELES